MRLILEKYFHPVLSEQLKLRAFRSRQLLCTTNLSWIAAFMIVLFFIFISTAQNLVERKTPNLA